MLEDSQLEELARRLHRGSVDSLRGLDFGPQDGYIHLEPHSGAYSVGAEEEFWGGFLLGRSFMMATLFDDIELRSTSLGHAPYVQKLSSIANVDTGFSGFFGLAMGYEMTGDEALRDGALESARNVARLFHEDIGVFLTHPAGKLDDVFMELPFSDVFCERELLVDTGAILDLLWWASKYEPSYRDMLIRHYQRCVELGVVGPDGQAHHALDFDSNGKPLHLHTHQGYQERSRWTRAQAWAGLGYATAAAATGLPEFLEVAFKAISKMLDNLDGRLVGPYDFDTPDPAAPEDSCSTLITIVAIERLKGATTDIPARLTEFQDAALDLVFRKYVTPGGTVLHGCWGTLGDFPVEAVMPYGNYFIAESVFRKLRPTVDVWGLPLARQESAVAQETV